MGSLSKVLWHIFSFWLQGKSSIWIDMRGCTFCPFVGTFFVQIEHGRRSPKVHQNRGANDCSFSFASMIRFNCCICKWRVLSVDLCISGTGGLNINLEGLLVRLWIYYPQIPSVVKFLVSGFWSDLGLDVANCSGTRIFKHFLKDSWAIVSGWQDVWSFSCFFLPGILEGFFEDLGMTSLLMCTG